MSLAQFIQKTIESEHQIEAYRVQMASIPEFEPNTVYKRLDQPRLGGVKIAELAEFAVDHNLELSNDALNYLFNYFDVDEDGIITREDFLKVVLSRENLKLADEVQQREPYEIQPAMFLPNEVEEAVFGFIMIILDNYQQLQQINLEGIDLNKEQIYDKDGFITIQSLQNYLQQQNIEIDDYAIIPFIQLLDKDETGKVAKDQLQKYIDIVKAQEELYEQEFEPQEEPLEQSQENLRDTVKREQIPVEQENESDESQKPKPPQTNDKQQEKQQQQQVKQQQQQPPQSQQMNQKPIDNKEEIEKQKQHDEQKQKDQRKAQQEQFQQDSKKAKQQLDDEKKKQEKEQSIQKPQQEENKYNSQQTFKPNQSKAEEKEENTEQKPKDRSQSFQKNDGLQEMYQRQIQLEKERIAQLEQDLEYVKGIKELYKPSPQKSSTNFSYSSPQKRNFKPEPEIDLYLQDIERRRREIQFEIELEKSKLKYLPSKLEYREPYSTSLERINFQIELEIQRIKRISEQNHRQQPANDILSMSNTGILDKINKQYPLTTPSRDYMKASSDEITPPKEINEEKSKDKSIPLKYQQEKILVESQEMK